MAALRNAGHRVSATRSGPDYIDPGYHALATGRPGATSIRIWSATDRWSRCCCTGRPRRCPPTSRSIEGVMGLYDGPAGREGFASTAHVAGLLSAPVILVVDISAASRTVAAVVHGLHYLRPGCPDRRRDPQQGRVGAARDRGHRRPAGDRAARCSGCCRAMTGSRPRRGIWVWCRRPSGGDPPSRRRLELAAPRSRPVLDLDAACSRIARGRRAALAADPWDPTAEMSVRRGSRRVAHSSRPSAGRWWRSPAAGPSRSATPKPTSCCGRPAASR